MAQMTADKIDKSNYGLQLFTRIAAGALVAASASFGWLPLVGAALVTTLLYSYQEYRTRKAHEKNLLELYRKDLASLIGKEEDAVTLSDMYLAARSQEKGGLGVITLSKQLKSDTRDEHLGIFSEALSSALISTTLILCRHFAILVLPTGPLGIMHVSFGALMGGAFALGHQFIDSTMDKWFGKKETDDKLINIDINNIAHSMTHEPVRSIEVFSVLVAANRELQDAIKTRYGAEFDKLPLKRREQVVQGYEDVFRTEALTQEINAGHIRPSFLGFLAYGQVSELLPDYRKYRQLFTQSPHAAEPMQENQAIHRERYLQEEKTPVSSRTQH